MADGPAITPSELRFRFQLNKQLLTTINIDNTDDRRCAFKIKTTAPKKYVVRPSSGVVDAKSSISVHVIMQAQKEYPSDFQNCKDKFMVQTTPLADDEQINQDTFNKETRASLREHRLKVSLEGPAAPPSPVPEANEVEDTTTASEAAAAAAAAGAGAADTRLRSTLNDLSSVSAENSTLKAQLDKVSRDNAELKRRLEVAELQGAKSAAGGAMPASARADTATRFKLSIIHIILAAIIAFLIGHYTR